MNDNIGDMLQRALTAAQQQKKKTVIHIESGQLDRHWRAVEAALIEAGCPVFVRGEHLVWPHWRLERQDEYGNGDEEVLVLRIMTYNTIQLADAIAHHAVSFTKYDARAKKDVNIDPPDKVVNALLHAGHWSFRSLRGVIAAPTMRANGSLLTEPGYDESTGLWYKAAVGLKLPVIPERPSRADGEAAGKRIAALFDGFPFADEASRAGALAGVSTAVLRGAFAAAPVFLVTAPEPRTGKTYLVQVIGVLATGHRPINTAGSMNPEEMEKRIETAGLAGRQILHFNNLPNGMTVNSQALSQISTEGQFVMRRLGAHEEGTISCQATTIFCNGNNIMMGDDLVDRTVDIRLDAKSDNPGGRHFASDPMTTVLSQRGDYLADCFIVTRSFLAAGAPMPKGLRYVSGFDAWSRFVQQPWAWLGYADCLEGQEKARALDPGREQLHTLITVLRATFSNQNTVFTIADLSNKASKGNHDLWELMLFKGQHNPKAFGHLLRRHLDRIDDGWCVRLSPGGVRVNTYQLYEVK
jgi:putative DNA primase/helicase